MQVFHLLCVGEMMLSKKRLSEFAVLFFVVNVIGEIVYGHSYANGYLVAAVFFALSVCVKEK